MEGLVEYTAESPLQAISVFRLLRKLADSVASTNTPRETEGGCVAWKALELTNIYGRGEAADPLFITINADAPHKLGEEVIRGMQ